VEELVSGEAKTSAGIQRLSSDEENVLIKSQCGNFKSGYSSHCTAGHGKYISGPGEGQTKLDPSAHRGAGKTVHER